MKRLITCFFIIFLLVKPFLAFTEDLIIPNSFPNKKETIKKDDITLANKKLTNSDEAVSSDNKNLIKTDKIISSGFSINVESSLNLNKNNLLKSPYNWSVGIPYSELALSYNFLKNYFFEIQFDFSYQNKEWNYFIDDLFIQYDFLFYISASLKFGYFSYPASYTSDNTKTFSKKTLMQKNLFPSGRRALGVLFEGNLWRSFYLEIGLQANINKRETDLVQQLGQTPVITSSLIYKKNEQKAFLTYFQKDLFLNGKMQSLGLGADLSHKINSWIFNLKGECWGIKKNNPDQTLWTYYVFPSIRWDRISFGTLIGGVHNYLQKDKSHVLEYILKGDFYLTENLFLAIEKLKEQDSIIKKEAWSFSLKADFNI